MRGRDFIVSMAVVVAASQGVQAKVSETQEFPWNESEVLEVVYEYMADPPSVTIQTWTKIKGIDRENIEGRVLAWGRFKGRSSKPIESVMVVMRYKENPMDKWVISVVSRNMLEDSRWRLDEKCAFNAFYAPIYEYDHPLTLQEVVAFTYIWFPPIDFTTKDEFISGGIDSDVWEIFIDKKPLSIEMLMNE